MSLQVFRWAATRAPRHHVPTLIPTTRIRTRIPRCHPRLCYLRITIASLLERAILVVVCLSIHLGLSTCTTRPAYIRYPPTVVRKARRCFLRSITTSHQCRCTLHMYFSLHRASLYSPSLAYQHIHHDSIRTGQMNEVERSWRRAARICSCPPTPTDRSGSISFGSRAGRADRAFVPKRIKSVMTHCTRPRSWSHWRLA